MSGRVHIKGLQATALVGLDHWQKPVPHPISVDVTFTTDFSEASKTDNLHHSLNYAVISDKIASFLRRNGHHNFTSVGGVSTAIYDLLSDEKSACSSVELEVWAPKVDIRAPVSFINPAISTEASEIKGTYKIHGLRALTLIGVFTFERLNKQYVSLNIELDVSSPHLPVGSVSEAVQTYLENANFKTVEALVASTSQWILQNFSTVVTAAVMVTKPNAIVYTEGVGVSCKYTQGDFQGEPAIELHTASEPVLKTSNPGSSPEVPFNLPVHTKTDYSGKHTAYVAFGSNMGNQLHNISEALRLLGEQQGITVDGTSSLYVSKPMYHTNQPDFYNGAVRLTVDNMSPHEVLRVLKHIEYEELARVKHLENGPRSIDLDLVLFDRHTVTTSDLVVPHKAMLDRTFVLQPLCELLPPDFTHPVTAEPIHNHLAQLLEAPSDPNIQESSKLISVVPGTNGRHLKFNHDGSSPTALMAIFNATPDSFSDGGEHYKMSPANIISQVLRMRDQGAHIIDVGGVSTRPGSVEPSEEEELERVLSVVRAIRGEPLLDNVLISVDTYRATVAEQALEAGADIINDISMGLYDEKIFDVVARYGCGYVMNHTRGTPATMSSMTTYGPAEPSLEEYNLDERHGMMPHLPDATSDLVNGVCREIASQIQKATNAGVRKWQIIIDPGIGFAKTASQNLDILRHGRRFKKYAQVDFSTGKYTSFHGAAVLIGTSRKRFLGTLTGQASAKDRVVATAASVVACVEQGADIVRVHDVKEVNEALLVADAIYKSGCV